MFSRLSEGVGRFVIRCVGAGSVVFRGAGGCPGNAGEKCVPRASFTGFIGQSGCREATISFGRNAYCNFVCGVIRFLAFQWHRGSRCKDFECDGPRSRVRYMDCSATCVFDFYHLRVGVEEAAGGIAFCSGHLFRSVGGADILTVVRQA